MPLYYFHLHERGEATRDGEGADLPDSDHAAAWAVRCARDVMSHEVAAGFLDLSSYIEVEDAQTNETLRVLFSSAVLIRS